MKPCNYRITTFNGNNDFCFYIQFDNGLWKPMVISSDYKIFTAFEPIGHEKDLSESFHDKLLKSLEEEKPYTKNLDYKEAMVINKITSKDNTTLREELKNINIGKEKVDQKWDSSEDAFEKITGDYLYYDKNNNDRKLVTIEWGEKETVLYCSDSEQVKIIPEIKRKCTDRKELSFDLKLLILKYYSMRNILGSGLDETLFDNNLEGFENELFMDMIEYLKGNDPREHPAEFSKFSKDYTTHQVVSNI